MAEARNCQHCGMAFSPRREHARFCSAGCRAAWNRQNTTDPAHMTSALHWSLTAMTGITQRLRQTGTRDSARGLAVISEAVWWVTLVDATLVRHHPAIYDRTLAAHTPAQRQRIEGTLGGLRFVRNQIARHTGPASLIHPHPARPSPGSDRITAWIWKPAPVPGLACLPPPAREWETARYQAYQGHLAGHTIGETFQAAAAFITLTATSTPMPTQASAHATH
jgi:hypothetical protein